MSALTLMRYKYKLLDSETKYYTITQADGVVYKECTPEEGPYPTSHRQVGYSSLHGGMHSLYTTSISLSYGFILHVYKWFFNGFCEGKKFSFW